MFRDLFRYVVWLTIVVAAHHSPAIADIVGPSVATSAISPDGHLIARIVRTGSMADTQMYEVVYFKFDMSKDRYERQSAFPLPAEHLPQMLFVSDAGDLVLISLSDTHAVRLYSEDGTTHKSWSLNDFLSRSEIRAC